jgi:FtsH-binding integral membrane protein
MQSAIKNIKNNQVNILFLSLLLIALAFVFNFAFKDGKPTCEPYLINTYLYLALAITFIGFVLTSKQVEKHANDIPIFALFLFTIGGIIALSITKGVVASHIIWIGIVLLLGLTMAPLFYLVRNDDGQKVFSALISTITVFLVSTLIAFMGHDSIKQYLGSFGLMLFVVLLSIILIELYYIFIAKSYPQNTHRMISYLVIILFSFYVVYDTVRIQERGKLCSKANPANYPKESLSFVLDLLNIFVRFLSLSR